MSIFYIRQGDTKPDLRRTLLDEDGVAVDLTTATAVVFNLRGPDGTVVIDNAAAELTTPAAGIVTYEWAVGDTADAGTFTGEFEVTWTGGGVQSFPQPEYLEVVITEQVA